MEMSYPGDPINVNCTANVQFEVIPPDVAEIPLPEDVSEIPLPSTEPIETPIIAVPISNASTVPLIPTEESSSSCILEQQIDNSELNNDVLEQNIRNLNINEDVETPDDNIPKTELKNESVCKLEHDIEESSLPKSDVVDLNTETETIITEEPEKSFPVEETPCKNEIPAAENEELCSVQQETEEHTTPTFEVIPPLPPGSTSSELIVDESNKNIEECIVVTEANCTNLSDAVINVVVTENQQEFVQYVVTTSSGNDHQSGEQKYVQYVVSDTVSSNEAETNPENVQAVVSKVEEEPVIHPEEEFVQYVAIEETAAQQEVEYVTSKETKQELVHVEEQNELEQNNAQINQTEENNKTEETVQYVESIESENTTGQVSNQENYVEYIESETISKVEAVEEVQENIQYVVSIANEHDMSEVHQDQHDVEYIESHDDNKVTMAEEHVQYIVSEADDVSNQQNYVQYVVTDSSGEKVAVSSANQSEYIEYVVSQDENQDNIVQYVVTSTGDEKDGSGHDESENYVGYIVSQEGDEKDSSNHAPAESTEVMYQVIDENSQQSQSEVLIEEMEVDEMPENGNKDQNDDIEIYVIEDDNMQTVIEVHVENVDEDSPEKNTKAVPDLVPLEANSKAKSNNKKRIVMGNYIEVVDAKGDTTAKLPCHVLGRNLKNPEADVLSNGRNPPKVRPGVKVPPMSLTSCIVSTEEISEEIDKKLKADVPTFDKPKGGDLLFKHKITKRLAEKLCTSPSSPVKQTAMQTRARNSPNTRLAKKNLLSQGKSKSDNADLLAILEGDDDPDWSELKSVETKDHSPPILQAIEKSIISGHSDRSPPPVLEAQQKPRTVVSRTPLKLDSEEIKRLAKHQLMNLPHVPNICSSRPRGRPKLTDYNPLKQTLLKNAGMAVYTTPRSKDPPKTYSNRKANDLIKNLVSDWDEESHDDPKPVTSKPDAKATASKSSPPKPAQSKPDAKPAQGKPEPKTAAAKTEAKSASKSETAKTVATAAKKVDAPSTSRVQPQAETSKPGPKPAATPTAAAATPAMPSAAKSPTNQAVKRKTTPPTAQAAQIGIVPNKIARIIKKKVIWDPDNPPAAAYSASPSSSSSTPTGKSVKVANATKSSADVTTPPAVPKKPLASTPHPKKQQQQVEKQTQEVQVVIEMEPAPEQPVTEVEIIPHEEMEEEQEPAAKPEPARKPKGVATTSYKPHKHMFAKHRLLHKTIKRDPKKPPLLAKKKKLTEIDRLLMDEGAVNMIYAVERSNNNAEVPEIVTKPNKRLLISLEKERRNLLSKANIIKQAVLRHSTSPGKSSRNTKPLRFKKGAAGMRKGGPMRKKSDASARTSVQSPVPDENPDFAFTEVNESRIIRRHSSSSFSSTCTSPRRLSVDQETTKPGTAAATEESAEAAPPDTPDSESAKPLKKRQKGVPMFVRPPGSDKTYKGKAKAGGSDPSTSSETVEDTAADKEEEKSNKPMSTRLNKKTAKNAEAAAEKTKQEEATQQKELSTCLEEAHVALTEIAVPESTPEPTAAPVAADVQVVKEELEPQTDEIVEETPKTSPQPKKTRKSSPAVDVEKTHNLRQQTSYKEISIRKHEHLVQIILTPSSSKFKNSLNLQAIRELREVLVSMSKDASCRVVLLTSSGNNFCHGIDYSCLVHSTAEKRRHAVQEMVTGVIELLRILAAFPKILVAGVHGAAVGLGATMLPLFDLVLASDKATFSVPATKHGYIPEGTSLMPWHRLLGHTVINELVLACRELTASEALQYGLVTRILWPDKFHAELIPTVKTLTGHSTQAMVVTKAMLRQQLLNGLDDALEMEEKQLFQMWNSSECQESFKTALSEGLWE